MTDGYDSIEPILSGSVLHTKGLTKREYFAAMAMQGILAHQSEEYGVTMKWQKEPNGNYKRDAQGHLIPEVPLAVLIAQEAVTQAEYLIEMLNKEK